MPKGRPIPAKQRQAIIETLEETHNAAQTARFQGVDYSTVWKIAKAAGIGLVKSHPSVVPETEITNPKLLTWLKRYALSLTKFEDSADELYSQTLLRACESLAKGGFENRNGTGLRPYLYKIMHHKHATELEYLSRQKRDHAKTERLEMLPEGKEPAYDHTASIERVIDAFKVIERESAGRRKTFEMMLAGATTKEVAQQLGLNPKRPAKQLEVMRERVQEVMGF